MQRRMEGPTAFGYASREAAAPAYAEREAPAAGGPRGRGEGSGPLRPARPAREAGDAGDPQRVKRLAAVAAASVALALVAAAYGTWAVLSSQAAIEAARAEAEPTLVAAADIRAGEAVEASSLQLRDVPRSLRVAGALGAEALDGAGSPVGSRALVDVPAGSQITPASLAGAAGGSSLSAALGAGMQAVTVAVDAESGIAGQLRPSDRVRVVAWEAAASGEALLSTVCDSVRVAALDADRFGGGAGYASVTLEVSPEQADAVRAAQYAGKVSLVLVSAVDALAADASASGPAAEPAASGAEGGAGAPLAAEGGGLDG